MKAIYHDIEQNSDEWFLLRAGRVGGSSIGKIMANYGKAFGQPAKDLAVKIAIEQITGKPIESTYTNGHMERGHEQEPIARALYEETTFCDVSNGGYFSMFSDQGVSPDGLVGEDGLIEIKSVIESVHYATVKRNSFDPSYIWQLYYGLMVTGREWVDFVSFCSNFPEGKRLYIHRVEADNCCKEFNMIDVRFSEFRQLVEEAKTTINGVQ
jgi:hypothetical protein